MLFNNIFNFLNDRKLWKNAKRFSSGILPHSSSRLLKKGEEVFEVKTHIDHEFQLHQNQLQWLFLLFLQNYESASSISSCGFIGSKIVENSMKRIRKRYLNISKMSIYLKKRGVIWFEYFETHAKFFCDAF